MTCHNVSNGWFIKRKEYGQGFNQTQEQSNLNYSPTNNQVNVAESRSGEVLSLEDTIGEVLYSAQVAQMWLLDSSITFHVTPNHE